MSPAYRIGQVAAKAGMRPDATRYCERLGVLPHPPRTAGGLRAYGDDAVPRVRFIQQAQVLGLTLNDVKELVANEGRGGRQRWCRRVRGFLKTRLPHVDARIREMQVFRRTLHSHLSDCERALEQDTPVCPVMIELGGRSQ